jgi:hypothetical protein
MNRPAAEKQCVEEKFSAVKFGRIRSRHNKLVKIILPGASRFSSLAAWTLAIAKNRTCKLDFHRGFEIDSFF